MKKIWNYLKDTLTDAKQWLLVIFLLLITYIFLAWLAYPESFRNLVTLMVALSCTLIILPFLLMHHKDQLVDEAMVRFLHEPNQANEDKLCRLMTKVEAKRVRALGEIIRQKEDENNQQLRLNKHYESYIEEWVHEIKKPMALLTLVLTNREQEMSPLVQQRLVHVRNQIDADVEKIVYFARLSASHQDYLFQSLDLQKLCQEAVEEQASLLEEAGFTVIFPKNTAMILADKKSFLFMLGQVINNSVKYVGKIQPQILFAIDIADDIRLSISDNGPGIPTEDLPFIFDKSFSGESKKATGIGLYLVQEMADNLAIGVKAESSPGEGLTITFIMPKVNL